VGQLLPLLFASTKRISPSESEEYSSKLKSTYSQNKDYILYEICLMGLISSFFCNINWESWNKEKITNKLWLLWGLSFKSLRRLPFHKNTTAYLDQKSGCLLTNKVLIITEIREGLIALPKVVAIAVASVKVWYKASRCPLAHIWICTSNWSILVVSEQIRKLFNIEIYISEIFLWTILGNHEFWNG